MSGFTFAAPWKLTYIQSSTDFLGRPRHTYRWMRPCTQSHGGPTGTFVRLGVQWYKLGPLVESRIVLP